ncbi:hypothetical protein KBC03_06175 [Patescibacteria group bacterium]|nr:hypothetical protein [Patescibacteria group bacterium]
MSFIFLAGCGTANKTTVTFDGLQVNISADLKTVSNAQLDSYQIINKILKAYKNGTETLIIARSSLNANITPQEYATASKQKIAQGVPGYQHLDDSATSFSCGKSTIQGYTHSFSIADTQPNNNAGKTYIIQYYFIANGTAYIISQADRTSAHYSDFTSMLSSLHCS